MTICQCGSTYYFDEPTQARLSSDKQSFHRCNSTPVEDNEISKAFDDLAETVYTLTITLGKVKT